MPTNARRTRESRFSFVMSASKAIFILRNPEYAENELFDNKFPNQSLIDWILNNISYRMQIEPDRLSVSSVD